MGHTQAHQDVHTCTQAGEPLPQTLQDLLADVLFWGHLMQFDLALETLKPA